MAFLLMLVQVVLGLYVLGRKKKANAWPFAGFCVSLALWTAGAYMLQESRSVEAVELWGRLIFVGPVFIVYFFLYFSLVFPSGCLRTLSRLILFLPALVLLAIIPTPLVLKEGSIAASGPVPVWGPAYPLFGIYFLLYFVAGIVNLFRSFRASGGNQKMQLRYLFAGLSLAFIFGIVFNLVFPSLGIGRYLILGPVFTLFAIAFTAYAIIKHHLLDISVVISRAVAELMTVLFLGGIFLTLVFFYRQYFGPEISPLFITGTIIFGVLVGQTHQRIRLFIQTTSDKLFLRGKYNYFNELSEISRKVGQDLSVSAILDVLYKAFLNVVEASQPRIFLPEYFNEPEKESKRLLIYDKETFRPLEHGEVISYNSALVETLLKERRPLLNPRDPKQELIVPCLLEDRLIAVFILGRKLSEESYLEEDVRMLEALANQAAIALDHARSYEKIKADLELMERQLTRSERLAALGTLTAGITHEIRNPLTVVRSETERIASKERDLDYLKKYRDLMLKHIDRIAGIVQRMLSMAKQKPHQECEVDLNELINSSLHMIPISGIQLKKELDIVPLIKGDPIALEEVFCNLFQNAVQAMSNSGVLSIRTYIDEGRAVVEISDTGKGIAPELLEKIFDPFFSTRHEGVGLGLSIAYRIIREHGGDIRVRSEVGKGTTFKLLF